MLLGRLRPDSRMKVALALLFLLALGIRVYYVSTAQVINPIRGDAVQYVAYGWNMMHLGIFSGALPGSAVVSPDSFRDPGYPLFLGALMKASGDDTGWYAGVLFAQALLGATTVVMATHCARRWLADSWALAAGALMALWPHSVAMGAYLLSETLLSFLVVLGLLLLGQAIRAGHRGFAVAAGLAFAAAGLTNAVLLPIGALVAIMLLTTQRPQRAAWILMLVANLLPLAAWQARGATLPTQQSATSRALLNFVQGSWPEFQGAYRPAVYGDVKAQAVLAAVHDEYQIALATPAAGARAIMARMAMHPLRYMAWYASKPALLWGWDVQIGEGAIYVFPTLNSPFETQGIWRAVLALTHALNIWLMLFAAAGIVIATRAPRDPLALATAGLIIYVTLVYSVLQSEPRYSFPFRPVEIVMAMTALANTVVIVRRHRLHAREPRT